MKLLYILILSFACTIFLYPSDTSARGKEKEICACATDFIESIAGYSCFDSSVFSKESRGRGYFYGVLGWESGGSCGFLVSDGEVSSSSCGATNVGTIDGSGACVFDGFANTSVVSSKEEGRACISFLREIDRYLESLSTCVP